MRKGKTRVLRIMRRLKRKARATFLGPKEEGFAIVIVLVALAMLSVLGAASLLLMVSALQGAVNSRPEDRAFQIAESALYVAHAMIVEENIPAEDVQPVTGSLLGGTYRIWIDAQGGFDYQVTAEGIYESAGTQYRRKLRETVSYSGPQSFDVLRNYLIFAGRDFNFNSTEGLGLSSMTLNGNIRAQRDINVEYRNGFLSGASVTFNGHLEAWNRIKLHLRSELIASSVMNVFGDLRTGGQDQGTLGNVELGVYPVLLALCRINAAVHYNIYADQVQKIYGGALGWGEINTGTQVREPGCEEVYIPKPNFDYYRALAQEQGNFYEGDRTFSGNLSSLGTSSVTVIYCTGNLTLNGVAWDRPNMKGIFVCEGDFTANNSLQFVSSSQFQVIARGNATFNNVFQYSNPESCKFFIYAGNDVYLNLMFCAGEYAQVTALRDVNLFRFDLFLSNASLNYLPPDIDVVGFPVQISVRDFKEISPDQP